MTSRWLEEKRAVADAARRMVELGLTTGASGNVSMRLAPPEPPELLAITPSGKSYGDLTEKDIVVAGFDLEPTEGNPTPSSESLMHVGIYNARPDVGAVIHTHSPFCSVAAVTGLEIPPILDEMVVYIGGAVQVSEYAFRARRSLPTTYAPPWARGTPP